MSARERDDLSLVDAAVDLALEGWEVFPCRLDKSPRTRHGFHEASSDPEVVAGWDWAEAMIGLAIPPGLVVIDVDPRNGGSETILALKRAGRSFPRTRVVQTAGGGQHYYFAVDPSLKLKSSLGTGVDVKRAGKGYVIAPPSPGYQVCIGPSDPAPAPEWLLDELRVQPREQRVSAAASPKFFTQFEEGTVYGLAARDKQLGQLVCAGEGERNNALNRAAYSLAQLAAGGELDEASTIGMLRLTAERIGLEDFEIERTLESGWNAGIDEPRQASDDSGTSSLVVPTPDIERFWLDWQAEEPDPEFLLDPVLPEGAYVLVYGPTAASKSMVFVALAAEGSRLGKRATVYSLENPAHIDRHRLRRLRPDPKNFRQSNEPLDLNDPRQFEAMLDREKKWKPDLIVIDTYSHAFESRSEDGNARAIAFARRVRYLMHETGATVVVVDHTGYMQEDEPRDASAKRQQVDVAVLMRQVGQWERGKPAAFSMENRKWSRFANPFLLNGKIWDAEGGALELEWVGQKPEWVR